MKRDKLIIKTVLRLVGIAASAVLLQQGLSEQAPIMILLPGIAGAALLFETWRSLREARPAGGNPT